ncbi:MAG: YihY/virulence factor BrkB family protein [Chloroflexota bacterium]
MDNDKPIFYHRLVNAAGGHATSLWEHANGRTNNYLQYLVQAIKNFSAKGKNEAVGFAYWALFSLFPLVVLAIILATFVMGARSAKIEVYNVLNQFIPSSVSAMIRDSLDEVVRQRRSYSVVSVIGLLFGATRLFTDLQRSLSRIFSDKRPRPWYFQILIGTAMIAVLALLLIISASLSDWLNTISLRLVGRKSPLVGVGTLLALLITNTGMFALLFRFIPRRKIAWPVWLPSALLAAGVFAFSRSIFDWYLLHVANFGVVYGSVSAVIGLLTWLFLTGCVILLCAEVAVATDDWRLSRLPIVEIPLLEQIYEIQKQEQFTSAAVLDQDVLLIVNSNGEAESLSPFSESGLG